MIQHDLVGLIRKLDEWPGRAPNGVAHVVLGADGRVAPNPPAAAWMMSRLPGVSRHVYALQLDRNVEIWDAQESIRPFLTNEETSLRFRIQVRTNATNAGRVAEALHHRTESPMDRLKGHLRAILTGLVDEEVRATGVQRVGNRILRDRLQWQNRIARSLEERTGLTAEIVFDGTPRSEVVEIAIGDLSVSPRDAPHTSTVISLHATLEPSGETPLDPLPAAEERRRARVERLVEEAVRREVTLHALWYAPERAAEVLRLRLSEALAQAGHRCTRLQLRPPRPPLPQSEQVDASLPWTGFRDREVIFHLDAIMTLREDGAGRYHAARSPERRAWLAENGAAALRAAMHGHDFYDLTADEQQAVGLRVGEALRREALAIGHDISPLTPEVRLPEKRWLTQQVLKIGPTLYPTKSGVEAEFSVSLEIRFRRLRPLIAHIDHGARQVSGADYNAAIEAAILDLVGETLRNAMLSVETHEYYAHWERWDLPFELPDAPGHSGPAPTAQVRNKLVHEIRGVLMSRLDAAEVKVHLHRIDGRLGEIMALLTRLGPFEVKGVAEPEGMERRTEEVPFELIVQVGLIEPGEAAAVMRRGRERLDPANIARSLLAAAQEFLAERSPNELRELNAGTLSTHRSAAAKQRLEEHLDRHMVRIYGFHVVLEKATTFRSASEATRLRGLALRDRELDAMLDLADHELEERLRIARTESERGDRELDNLYRMLDANPRQSQRDLELYRETLMDIADAKRRTGGERQSRLAAEAAQRVALLPGGGAPARGRPANEEPEPRRAVAPDDIEPPRRAAGDGDEPGF